MLARTLACLGLIALTVAVHSLGLTGLLRWVWRSPALRDPRWWSGAWLLIRVAWCLLAIHMVEITLWGAFFWWQQCLPDATSAIYFSGVTYASIGYGDLLLPAEWRLFSPVEGLTGILMCGLSTAFFFALLSKLYEQRTSRGPSRAQ